MSHVKVLSFLASVVNAQNLVWMQLVARAALLEPTHVTSSITIPTPLCSATVSLPITDTPSRRVVKYSLSAHNEFLQTVWAMAQQHAELPLQLSKEVAKVVQPLLDVHRSAAMGTSAGPATSLAAPSAKQQVPRPANASHSTQARSPAPLQAILPSPAGMGIDSSGAAYATPGGSMSEGVELLETDMTPGKIAGEDCANRLGQDVASQIGQPQ